MNKKEKTGYREGIAGPFGPPPEEYKYRCSVCGTELMVNEAIIDAGRGVSWLGLAPFSFWVGIWV